MFYYDLLFLGEMGLSGMSFAKDSPGKQFHGVLHKISLKDMKTLDRLEIDHKRIKSKVVLYDGANIECSVYQMETKRIHDPAHKPHSLSERLIKIMIEGAT